MKKIHLSDSVRMKFIREQSGLSQSQLSELLGIKQDNIKSIENSRARISVEIALLLEEKLHLDFRWILTGQGEPRPKAHDPERSELLRMASEILDSRSDYSASLAANIRSLHSALTTERRLAVLEGEIAGIKRSIRIATERLREGDPAEKKEEILQKRAISSG